MRKRLSRSLPASSAALLLAALVSIALLGQAQGDGAKQEDGAMWPKTWTDQAGKQVTLEGVPANAKLGALLVGEEDEVWIDGLEEWPREVFGPDGKGKRLKVTGTVVIREDLPAYVQKPGEPPKTGIPVQHESQLKAASTRVLLKDANWTIVK